MISAPQGCGKTTLSQRIILVRIGLRKEKVLGYTVQRARGKILVLVMDRPEQWRRSFLRMVTEEEREYLNRHLIVWKGPLPFDIISEPKRLATWMEDLGASDVVIDSCKDLNPNLQRPEVAGAINIAAQEVVTRGLEWLGLNHQRKSTSENKKPNTLDDVFGGQWLTSGLGSVVILWGTPGATEVEFLHRKPPEAEVGPFTIQHNHKAGLPTRKDTEQDAVLREVQNAGEAGINEPDIVQKLCSVTASAEEREATRKRISRRLAKLWNDEEIKLMVAAQRGGKDGSTPNRWVATHKGEEQ
jgi:hypothetical protein